jgi:hypothetical protein
MRARKRDGRQPQDAILGALIEGELSASETYRRALERAEGAPEAGELRRIEGEHRQAASVLRERCRCSAPVRSGAWGDWSPGPDPGSTFGGEAAILALKQGEEQEIREYEMALESEAVAPECKRLIASMLLPQTRSHLQALDRFMRRQNPGP